MNCERFEIIVSDLAREEIMDANERRNALNHVGECEQCRHAWKEQRRLTNSLRDLAGLMNSMAAPAHTEQRLLELFRERAIINTLPAKKHWWPYGVGAAAAVLLLVFGFVVWRWQQSVRQPANQANGGNAAKYESSGDGELLRPAPVGNEPAVSRPQEFSRHSTAPRRVTRNRPVRHSSTVDASGEAAEIATDFLPVGYVSALDLQDGGQLVRVELPRFALARFGFPVNMDRADERVKADVLVGTDGLARAIRFVR